MLRYAALFTTVLALSATTAIAQSQPADASSATAESKIAPGAGSEIPRADEKDLSALPPSAAQTEAPSKKDEGAGLLLPWAKVGVTVGVGFPQLLELGLESRILNRFGVGFGFVPNMNLPNAAFGKEIKLALKGWNLRARWYPFAKSFFVGAKVGTQSVLVSAKMEAENPTGSKSDIELMVTGDTTFFTPKFGWLASWDSGFTLGTEFGYQIAASASSSFDVSYGELLSPAEKQKVTSEPAYLKRKADVESVRKKFVEGNLPYWNIITIGWMF